MPEHKGTSQGPLGNQGWELHTTEAARCGDVRLASAHVQNEFRMSFFFSSVKKRRRAAFGCRCYMRSSPVCSHKKQHRNAASTRCQRCDVGVK